MDWLGVEPSRDKDGDGLSEPVEEAGGQ